MGRKIHEDGSKAGKGMSGSRHIARERSESAYIWGKDRKGNTGEVGIGDKEE